MASSYQPVTPSDFKSPLPARNFYFPSAHTIFPYKSSYGSAGSPVINTYTQIITSQTGEELFKNEYKIIFQASTESTTGEDVGETIKLQNGQTYTVKYVYTYPDFAPPPSSFQYITITATYTFWVVENQLPLKQWTITSVIERLLDIAEPIRMGEKPRFRLQGVNDDGSYQEGSQAEKFDKILAPQFSFTKQTLRECLKEIGGVVHGEPRLDIKQDGNGTYYYEVSFDLYGQTEKSGIWAKPYILKTVSQVIDSYASCLDSNAENLVNQLDKYAGVIVEPYSGGYKTVRTESMYVRITEENMIIPTQYPIYTIEKLECGYIDGNGDVVPPVDITQYVFESSVYNSRLSSYSEEYPYSKAYAVMYTQGQKNISALNFKPEHPISSIFNNYAILNILRRVTEKNIIITQSTDGTNSYKEGGYPLLAFRVTYTPFYNSRVGQSKVNYKDYLYPAALIYNQQANVIESRFYGENLKGAIARIGNVDKSITYNLAFLSDIPKAGQMYNDDYYISTVAVEYLPTYIKCTIGLSKDFNRLSQYIGISSVKRYSEVSQGQALERNTLWKEYIVIGSNSLVASSDCYIGDETMKAIADTFTQSGTYTPLTNVVAWGRSYWRDLEDVTADVTITKVVEWRLNIKNQANKYVKVNYLLNGEHKARIYHPTEDSYTWLSVAGVFDDLEIISAYVTESSPQPAVNLPVISSAFGNSIAFSWAYEDNYSAGAISQYAESGGESTKVTGYFQNNYQYTDYYGKMYYYDFDLQESGTQITSADQQKEIGKKLPQGERTTTSSGFISTFKYSTDIKSQSAQILRKDNREKLQCNFQIDFVSNRNGLIIGSALASYCPLVRGTDTRLAAKLYVFDEPINKFINHVEGSVNVELKDMTGYAITVSSVSNGKFSITADNFAVSGKSWAIVTAQYYGEEYEVEDEKGNIFTQKDINGGDVLLAQNMDISAGQEFTPIYFIKQREVFDKSVWTAIR